MHIHEPVPLIIVEGFLGGTGAALWGDFQHFLNNSCDAKPRRVIFASVGSVSSLHDRACELYYALGGGTVDYGETHSKEHGHSRYGRTNRSGLYPQWSTTHPLHFLGHSIGGPTISKLQYLLERRYFSVEDHPSMILSINTISSPFRGTQLVYTLGERVDAAPAVRPFSIGSLIAKCVHLVTFFSPLLPQSLDLHAESRPLTYKEISFISWLKQLWSSDWAESRDATPFDMTFEAADERENAEGHTYPRTFYRSHVIRMDSEFSAHFKSAPLASICSAPLYLTSQLMWAFDFATLQPIPSFLNRTAPISSTHPMYRSLSASSTDIEEGFGFKTIGIEYRTNDGIVPTFSQWHPLPCSLTRCLHETSTFLPKKLEPGMWYVTQEKEANHVSLVPLWRETLQQKTFWEGVGRWLRAVDDALSDILELD